MPYKAIIWDLDGTLVESLPGIAHAANQALIQHGLPSHSDASIRSFIGDGSWMLLRRAATQETDDTIHALNQTFKSIYQENWNKGTEVFAGILELLTAVKEKKIINCILSNKPHHFTSEIAAALFPANTFDFVLGQKDDFPAKPSPESTLLTLENIQVDSTEVLFIGDSTIDIQTANNANVDSAAVTWGYHDLDMLTKENPTHLVHSVDELTALLSL